MWGANDADQSGAGYFLNNTESNVDSPSQNKKGNVRRLQSVVPVVIRQIRDCHDDEFKLFGMSTQILHIVGILRDFEVQSTKATYNIEDHTGMIKAIWWLENDSESTPNLPPVKEGSYVQVFGSLRNQENEKIMMVLRMFLVDDCNLITSHLLQVIHTRLQAEYISKNQGTLVKTNHPGAALANSMSFIDENVPENGQNISLTIMQDKIFRLLQGDLSDMGVNRQAILKHFPANQHRDVNAAIEFLINEGHVYSTIDNDHFKSTAESCSLTV